MIAILQRCREASVAVAGKDVARIGAGYLLLLGVEKGDQEQDLSWLSDKVAGLRLFPDAAGKMNLDLRTAGGEILCVSQFTLLADCQQGRRPGFSRAEEPERARDLWMAFCQKLEALALPVQRGIFAADMQVALVNDGPVTVILDSRRRS